MGRASKPMVVAPKALLVRRNEVVVLGGVNAGNHDFSVPGDY